MFKPGADFEADNQRGYNTYAFSRAIGNSPPHAYQVWRQDFDKMLFEHARECGADGREGHEVVSVEQIGPRETRLDVRTDEGREYSIQARYVVDASGRAQQQAIGGGPFDKPEGAAVELDDPLGRLVE